MSFSKYTGEKSIRQTGIHSSGSLSVSVDVLQLDNLRAQINDYRQKIANAEAEVKGVDGQVCSCHFNSFFL